MKNFWKGTRLWIFAMIVGFYTTFVLQNLWNWFVAPAFNIGMASYWLVYGINMLLQMLLERNTFTDDDRWKRTLTMQYASVPPEKKEEVDEVLNEENDNVWMKAGTDVFGKIVGNTATLGIGWAVHTFLA